MLHANELMLGDWVNVTAAENIVRPNVLSLLPKRGKVVGIDGDWVYVDFIEHPFMFGDIEPIPLTPEILEKNGFEKLNNYQWKYRDNSCKIVVTIAPEIEIDGESLGTSPVNIMLDGALFDVNITFDGFVHEFQRVLRCVGLFELANNFKI